MKHIYMFMPLTVALLLLSSCGIRKTIVEVPYIQNSDTVNLDNSAGHDDMIIRPKDALNIFVFASDPKSVAFLNLTERRAIQTGNQQLNNQAGFRDFLVDNDGNIDYPVLGKINVAGKTVHQAAKQIQEGLSPLYNKDGSLLVNVRLINFYVSVLGEVNRPNTFEISGPSINVLEALAMAGDLTIYGIRSNVKLLREGDNGEFEVHKLDLTDANLLNSPYYYLQQRDILYVEPNSAMAQNAMVGRTTQLWVRGASITISLGSLLYRVLR